MPIYIASLKGLKMDKFTANDLLDQYENLLTDKQQKICQLYYREDLSLMEISELMSITRAAVHDTLKRCEKLLASYEKNLSLCAKSHERFVLYQQIKAYNITDINDIVDKLIDTE